jgi:Fe-S-cluster containining protein
MINKALKFLSSEDAINEVFLDLAVHPDKWYELALFAKVFGFLTNGKARPGQANSNAEDLMEKGIWYAAKGEKIEKFIPAYDFKELAIDLIPKVTSRIDEIAQVYEWTMWVKTFSDKGPDGEEGIWVETEMEKFQCTRCGHCCLKLHDAYCTSIDMEDVQRWRKEKRWDILEWVHIMNVGGEELFADIWFSPTTGEEATRCPWLRKLPNKNIYKCRIHETKPSHCRNFPKSKKHALTTGCKGFGDDPTFERVKRNLEKLYDNSQKFEK